MKAFALFPQRSATTVKRAARRDEGVTPYMFLLATFKTLLHRYSGQADMVVGGVADARPPSGV